MRRIGCLIALLGLLSTAGGCKKNASTGADSSKAEALRQRDSGLSAPDVVVILIDTLRRDHLPFYGYEDSTAPFMQQLSGDSVVFQRAFSASSWTAPSTATLFTGLYPPQHGVVQGFFANKTHAARLEKRGEAKIDLNRISDDLETLPEVFAARGYQTFGVASNINIGEEMGFASGFDSFSRMTQVDADELAEHARTWVKQANPSMPTFMYFHFNDVHKPYQPRAPWYKATGTRRGDRLAAYDSEIRFVDEVIRGLYTDLGWQRNTLLVLVSDHGEEFRDHGGTLHGPTLYPELTRILWMVHSPGVLAADNIDTPVSGVDFLPTMASLLGWQPATHWQGVAALGALESKGKKKRGGEVADQRMHFLHREKLGKGSLWGAYWDRFLYIERPNAKPLLFDYLADPGATLNIAAQYQDFVATLQGAVQEFRAKARKGQAVQHELDQDLMEQLRSLGYVE